MDLPPGCACLVLTDEAIEVVPLGNGRYHVTHGSTAAIAFAVGRARHVGLPRRPRLPVSDTADGAPRRSHGDEHGALAAPMPATVVAIKVAPGQRVERDEVVMVLEAMKMELPISAPRDGGVKAVHCRSARSCSPGRTLFELDEREIRSEQ